MKGESVGGGAFNYGVGKMVGKGGRGQGDPRGPLYGWIGYSIGDSERILFGRYRSIEGHGDGENFYAYDRGFDQWWSIVLVMVEGFTYGRIRGTT
ncbi:UNVERIFIED_CONTAM: hypothetical protein Sindi_0169800 [Sesamum indicum]